MSWWASSRLQSWFLLTVQLLDVNLQERILHADPLTWACMHKIANSYVFFCFPGCFSWFSAAGWIISPLRIILWPVKSASSPPLTPPPTPLDSGEVQNENIWWPAPPVFLWVTRLFGDVLWVIITSLVCVETLWRPNFSRSGYQSKRRESSACQGGGSSSSVSLSCVTSWYIFCSEEVCFFFFLKRNNRWSILQNVSYSGFIENLKYKNAVVHNQCIIQGYDVGYNQ